jgi:hypothetical protein
MDYSWIGRRMVRSNKKHETLPMTLMFEHFEHEQRTHEKNDFLTAYA